MDIELSVIIPFLNEGIEIRNTVESIRHTAGSAVNILLVNDASEDNYDYELVAKDYNAVYYKNEERQGVAKSRDIGVSLIKTPYFILIDGHMRFYDNNWWIEVVKCLNEDDRAIYSCQCVVLDSIGERVHNNHAYGAFIDFLGIFPHDILNANWITYDLFPYESKIEIPCVMGASYVASKRYWGYINGLKGLISYGVDEQYMSLKTWLEGGRCILLKNIEIGHIFREKQPYSAMNVYSIYNKLFIAETVLTDSICTKVHEKIKRVYKSEYYLAFYLLNKEHKTVIECKEYYKKIFTKSIDSFFIINNQGKNNFDLSYKMGKKLNEISIFLMSKPSEELGLMEGEIGEIMFLYEFSYYKNKPEIADYADERLSLLLKKATSGGLKHYNLYAGAAGLGVALDYLNQKGYIEINIDKYFEDIEPAMNEYVINELNKENIDYFHQALGVEYYFSRKSNYQFANIGLLLNIVDEILNDNTKSINYVKTLLFFAYIYQLGYKGEKIYLIISKLINLIKRQENNNKIIYNSGNLINIYALFKTAVIISNDNLLNETIMEIENISKNTDPIKGYVWDSGLYRGSAGTALIYYLLYHNHKSNNIYNALGYWFYDILEKSIYEDGTAGFVSYDNCNNSSFLYGASGIGLTIISILKGEIPLWKEFLLL